MGKYCTDEKVVIQYTAASTYLKGTLMARDCARRVTAYQWPALRNETAPTRKHASKQSASVVTPSASVIESFF